MRIGALVTSTYVTLNKENGMSKISLSFGKIENFSIFFPAIKSISNIAP